MENAYEILRNVELVLFVVLAVTAIRLWRRVPDETHAWLAATFTILAAVIVTSRLLPEHSDETSIVWARKVLVAVLVLFPYCLYRFMVTLVRRYRWVFVAAGVVTAGLVVAALALPALPEPGEPRPAAANAFIIVLLVQWTGLSLVVAARLWRAGRGEPTVARRRMRTLALGALGLAAALVLAGTGSPNEAIGTEEVVVQFLGLLSAPLFLLGFSPPGWVTVLWRRPEERALREAAIGLMGGFTSSEIADSLLPHATRLVGGRGSVVIASDGTSLGSFDLDDDEIEKLSDEARARSGADPRADPISQRDSVWVPLQVGWLVVRTSPLTPFFGVDEVRSLQALGVLTDMALTRAQVYERERQNLEMMRDFVAIASHDLRTPIAIVRGFSNTLTSKWHTLSDEEKVRMVEAIHRNGGQLSRLTEDMLTISNLETGAVEPIPEKISVTQCLERLVRDLAVEIPPAEIRADGEPVCAHVDPGHFERMMTNYLRNAHIYGSPPVVVEVAGVGNRVEIRVKDRGPGVSREFAPRLFDKFSRENKKTSRATEGTGLGLSIVQGLARAAGGGVWYEPNEPRGAIFGLWLPRIDCAG